MEKGIITCVPVNAEAMIGIPYKPGEGYTIAKCEMCENDMHLGPKQKEYKDDCPDAQMVCMVCMARYFEEGLPVKTLKDAKKD
jgi:hypothetical protein